MPKNKQHKQQGSSEFLTTYGFAVLIIAIIFVGFYLLTSSAQSSIPTTCTFSYGTYCNDLVLASNSMGSHAVFLFTNTQQYALVNPQMTINSSSTGGASTGTCEPYYVPAGSAIICNVTITGNEISVGSQVNGQVRLTGITCPSGNANSCVNSQSQTFLGTFNTHVSALSTSNPVSITLIAHNYTQLADGTYDQLTAKVMLLGYPLTGGSVNFTSNRTFAHVSPSTSVSNSNGDAYSFVQSQNGTGNVKINASFAGHKASIIIGFLRPVYVTFETSGASGAQGTILTVDGNSFTQAQLPYRFEFGAGTQHTYSFATLISGASGTRYSLSSISGCSFTASSQIFNTSSSCSATADYSTQYYLTMAASPSAGGSVSPLSGWENAGSQITISQSPAAGYAFSSWSGSGAGSYSGTNPSQLINLNNPISETAVFTSTSTSTSTSTTISSTSTSTSSITITTTSTTLSTTSTTTSSSTTLSTTTISTQYSLSIVVYPSGAGTVSPSAGTHYYAYGTQVPISATPGSGYKIYTLTGNGASGAVSGSGAQTATINGNITEDVHFYTLTPSSIYCYYFDSEDQYASIDPPGPLGCFTINGTAVDELTLNQTGWPGFASAGFLVECAGAITYTNCANYALFFENPALSMGGIGSGTAPNPFTQDWLGWALQNGGGAFGGGGVGYFDGNSDGQWWTGAPNWGVGETGDYSGGTFTSSNYPPPPLPSSDYNYQFPSIINNVSPLGYGCLVGSQTGPDQYPNMWDNPQNCVDHVAYNDPNGANTDHWFIIRYVPATPGGNWPTTPSDYIGQVCGPQWKTYLNLFWSQSFIGGGNGQNSMPGQHAVSADCVYTTTTVTTTVCPPGGCTTTTSIISITKTLSSSFVADTKVMMANGTSIPISQIQPGASILSYNTKSGKFYTNTVVKVINFTVNGEYLINNLIGTDAGEVFYTSNGTWTHPNDLKIGDKILDPITNSWINVTNVSYAPRPVMVYDIIGSSGNDFIVDGGYLSDIITD